MNKKKILLMLTNKWRAPATMALITLGFSVVAFSSEPQPTEAERLSYRLGQNITQASRPSDSEYINELKFKLKDNYHVTADCKDKPQRDDEKRACIKGL